MRGPSRSGSTHPPRCAHCRLRIGVYEPLVWQRPDGALIRSGWLLLREDPLHHAPGSLVYHPGCAAAGAAAG